MVWRRLAIRHQRRTQDTQVPLSQTHNLAEHQGKSYSAAWASPSSMVDRMRVTSVMSAVF